MSKEGAVLWAGMSLLITGVACIDWRWAIMLAGIGVFTSGCVLVAEKGKRRND